MHTCYRAVIWQVGPLRITKFGHACVRVKHDGVTLVVDPGGWTEPEARLFDQRPLMMQQSPTSNRIESPER